MQIFQYNVSQIGMEAHQMKQGESDAEGGGMLEIILKGKHDIQSFCLKDSFEVVLSSEQGTRRLNFGDRIVYLKFHEEEATNKMKFPYYNLLGGEVRTTTLLKETGARLIQQIESDTGNFYSSGELKHYVIIAENHIMEIVSYDEVAIGQNIPLS